jgi:hypothetical protein
LNGKQIVEIDSMYGERMKKCTKAIIEERESSEAEELKALPNPKNIIVYAGKLDDS